jgi:predicted ester cyclase
MTQGADDRLAAASRLPQNGSAMVHRLVEEVINGCRLEVVEELFSPELATRVAQGMAGFRAAFPDWREEIVDLITDGEKLAVRLRCSGTFRGEFMGAAPNGGRQEVDEVAFLRIRNGRFIEYWVLEDNLARLRQLGLVSL